MVYAKLMSNNDGIDEIYKILSEVFVNENKFDEEDIIDELNEHVYHVLVYEGNSDLPPIATGRVIIDGESACIKLVAVKEQYRKKQYGDMVVRMLLEKARSLYCSNIETVIPESLLEMFKKIGFKPIKDISNIKHKSMFENSIRMKFDNYFTSKCN